MDTRLEWLESNTLQKWVDVCVHAALKNSNEIQKLNEQFIYNFKLEQNIKGADKKLKLISGSTTNSGLSNHTTFRQIKSRVPVPLILFIKI